MARVGRHSSQESWSRGDESLGNSKKYGKEKAMTGSDERAADAALWRRCRRDSGSAPGAEAPDPILLAAYAEGRLDETEAEPVEAWLAEHLDALEDMQAASQPPAVEAVPERVLLRAQSLVRSGSGGGTIMPFPPAMAQRHGWRSAAAWGALAASLLVTSYIGFGIGNSAYDTLTGQNGVIESAGHELIDPPSTFFDESEGT
jgi:hypothetical protein